MARSSPEPQATGEACPKCDSELVERTGRFGPFIACSNHPKCKYTQPMTIPGLKCPKCGEGEIGEKRTRKGKPFWGCARYPECDWSVWDQPVAVACPTCEAPFLLERAQQEARRVLHAAWNANRRMTPETVRRGRCIEGKLMADVTVVGGGLAGCEAAWQLAERGHDVTLVEMRPVRSTPAHQTGDLAELVCTNSFKSEDPTNAHGLLKAEMRALGSLLLSSADASRVPAGTALAVDREIFARRMTTAMEEHPRITLERREVTALPDGPAVIATGPLTSDALTAEIQRLLGDDGLAFYDSIAPIVAADSVDMDIAWLGSRWEKGEGRRLPELPHGPTSSTTPSLRRCARPTSTRATTGRTSPTSRAACPSRSWRSEARRRCASDPCEPVGLPEPRTGRDGPRRRPAPTRGPPGPDVEHGRLPDPPPHRGAARASSA